MLTRSSANTVNVFALLLLPVSIMAHAFWLPRSVSATAISDAGFMSIITLTFLACALLSLFVILFSSELTASKITTFAAAYAILIYFLREADVHRLFTIEHVTRPKFYFMENVPFWQKAFAAMVFLILAICLLYLLFRYASMWWQNLRNFQPWAVALLLWFLVLLTSQLCDKSDLNRTHFGRAIEESCECWAAIFLFLTVVQIIPTLNLRNS